MNRPLTDLIKAAGHCRTDAFCLYHAKKRNNFTLLLKARYDANSAPPLVEVAASADVVQAIRAMENEFCVAGSWQLMGEQRDWFCKRVARVAESGKREIVFAILGIPGVTHLFETEKLVRSVVPEKTHVNFLVIEQCIGPLMDIAKQLQDRGFERSALSDDHTPKSSWRLGNNVFTLIQADLSLEFPLAANTVDVVSSHLLFSFLSKPVADSVIRGVAASLRQGGHFLVAQEPTSYMMKNISQYFKRSGLSLVDFGRSWNLYALSAEQRQSILRGYGIRVQNDTFLMDLSRPEGSDAAVGAHSE